jgi:aspartate/methionine/tyrosine aminotransferase
MRKVFDRRRLLLIEGLRELGLSMPEPRGAFYAFPDVSDFLDERGSVGFCDDLLAAENLVLVPGSAFGADRHVRLSYALGEDMIREALTRLGRFLDARRG